MERWYTLRDASELLGIKVRTLREWLKQGKVKAVKYPNGKNWYIREKDLMRLRGERYENKD